MRSLRAFAGKEVLELIRTGRLYIYLCIFLLFGILNPAIAKLTPWMMEMASDGFADAGLVISEIKVDALTSWTQYYKNLPILIIVFVILSGNTLTGEYQKGTLIHMLTKGLQRWKVVAAKGIMLTALWSVCYWMYFGVTYAYTAYFWDNGIASHLLEGAFCPYLFGIWLIAAILLMSVFCNGNAAVLSPTKLLGSGDLLGGGISPSDYMEALAVTGILSVLFFGGAVVGFNKKRL